MRLEYKPVTKKDAAILLAQKLSGAFGCDCAVPDNHPFLVWVLPIEVCLPLMGAERPAFGRMRIVRNRTVEVERP